MKILPYWRLLIAVSVYTSFHANLYKRCTPFWAHDSYYVCTETNTVAGPLLVVKYWEQLSKQQTKGKSIPVSRCPQSGNSVPLVTVTVSCSPDAGFYAMASEGSGKCFLGHKTEPKGQTSLSGG